MLNLIDKKKPYAIALVYIVFSFQNISIVDFDGFGIKIYHFVLPIMILSLLFKKNIFITPSFLYVYLIYIISASLIFYLFNGFDSLFFNYVFCLGIVVLGNALAKLIYIEDIVDGLKKGAFFIALISLVNIVYNYGEIKRAHIFEAVTGVRPDLDFLIYGGGVNLESSWIALSCAFFIKDHKKFILMILISFFIDFSLMSRSGVVITGLVFLYWLFFVLKIRIIHLSLIFIFSPIFLYLLAEVIAQFTGLSVYDRFANIGNEPGSLGRLNMWKYVPDAIYNNLFFAAGAGNGIKAIGDYGFIGPDGNLHNYIFHNLIEFGLLGLVLWLIVAFSVFKKTSKELKCYFYVFFAASLVQFRGAEILFYFVLSILIFGSYGNKFFMNYSAVNFNDSK